MDEEKQLALRHVTTSVARMIEVGNICGLRSWERALMVSLGVRRLTLDGSFQMLGILTSGSFWNQLM